MSTLQTPLRSSAGPKGADASESQVKQLKARIANLEKSYEFSKQKISVLEESNRQKDAENKKQQEEIAKLKNIKAKLTKEIGDLQKKNTEADRLKIEDLIPTRENADLPISDSDQQSVISDQPNYPFHQASLLASQQKQKTDRPNRQTLQHRSPSGSKQKAGGLDQTEMVQPSASKRTQGQAPQGGQASM